MGGPIQGKLYLVMMLDIYSRKITGWEVFLAESTHNSRTVLEYGTGGKGGQPTPCFTCG